MENKKNPTLDLRKKSGLFLNLGLVISLSFVLFAFEYKSYSICERFVVPQSGFDTDESFDVPLTDQTPPPPPTKEVIIEVSNDIEIEEPTALIDNTFEEDDSFKEPTEIEELGIEPVEEAPFIVVERMPTYPGGLKALYKYLGKKMRYPSQARRMNIDGKVILSFVIDKEGNITNIKLLRGIGAGCDKEAIRVLATLPKWSPGKQRGKPVKVQMTLPINFKLN
ncbi:MAG: energy transducer TonB [Cyclobacteriaceae bacterium]|nr:energy transducer TonB [Cyclobacteriaceae bacterium]